MSADPARLYTALLNTGLQQKDNALYQVIRDLIAAVLALASTSSSSSSSSTGGLTNAQIMARILLDSGLGGGGSSSGLSGATGPAGPIGPTGPTGIPGFGIDGEDGDILYRNMHLEDLGGGDQSFLGNMKPSTMQMFSWTSKLIDTSYQAASDGLFLGFFYNTSTGADVEFRSDASNPPVTARQRSTSTVNNIRTPFMIPVRKGDFYKAVGLTGDDANMQFTGWWVPLGVNG